MNAHPASELFPLMEGDELQALVDDIRERGLQQPVVLLDGAILDGRNRLRACELAGVAPRFEDWDGTGGSPVEWVISSNLHRRHLTASQRATVAVGVLPLLEAEAKERQRMSEGRGAKGTSISTEVLGEAREKAATLVGVSAPYVSAAKALKREDPDAFDRVHEGTKTLPGAVRESLGREMGGQRTVTPDPRPRTRNKHPEVVHLAEQIARLSGRWTEEMCVALTPPEARKQLTTLTKAAELLAEVIAAVEYRSATLHTYAGR